MKTESTEIRERILKLLGERGELTTMEVSEQAGLSMPVTRYYLKALAFEGRVSWRRLGKRVLVWRLKE